MNFSLIHSEEWDRIGALSLRFQVISASSPMVDYLSVSDPPSAFES